jgi:hypothetical protein
LAMNSVSWPLPAVASTTVSPACTTCALGRARARVRGARVEVALGGAPLTGGAAGTPTCFQASCAALVRRDPWLKRSGSVSGSACAGEW